MRKLLLFILLTVSVFHLSAQIRTQVVGDTVLIHNNTGKAEVILKNSTDSINGFLFNKGDGLTEFRKGLVKLNDSAYIIGADTLYLPGINGLNRITDDNVFYVSRKFQGAARAVVGGYTIASISSTNESYNLQLSRARPGSMVLSYPDPFSARNAAMEAIAGEEISTAVIVVMENNGYTIGSPDSTKNGSVDGQHPNNGTVADIQFSQSSLIADSSLSSIMKHEIDMLFGLGSSLTYINSKYPVYCYYYSDQANSYFRSGVYGLGNFWQIYGQRHYSVGARFSAIESRRANVDFYARKVVLQQSVGFEFADFENYNVEIKELVSADASALNFGKIWSWSETNGKIAPAVTSSVLDKPRLLNVHINECRYGHGQTGYQEMDNDWWYFITIANNTALEGTKVMLDIDNLNIKANEEASLFYINSHSHLFNMNFTVNIGNFVHDAYAYPATPSYPGLILCNSPGEAVNNTFNFNINSAVIDCPLLGMMSFSCYASNNPSYTFHNRNNILYINVNHLEKRQSILKKGIFNATSMLALNVRSGENERLKVKVNGHFVSDDGAPLINVYDTYWSYPYPNNYEFSGTYENLTENIPVVRFYRNTGKMMGFTNATFINHGTSPSIVADSVCLGDENGMGRCLGDLSQDPLAIPIYIKNVHTTNGVTSNIQPYGDDIKVYPEMWDYFK